MTTNNSGHLSVLLDEAVNGLNIHPDGIYIDGTFGRGGHSRLILSQLSDKGQLIAIDRDPQAIEIARQIADPRFTIIHGPFSQLAYYIEQRGLKGKIAGILLDLGVSSPQLDDPQRGFSFMRDGPLDMRMDTTQGQSAAQWLATVSEDELGWVLKTFAEERFAKRIAKAIVTTRQQQPLTTTKALADLITQTLPFKERHKHPATRTFQAIRIFINSELDEIRQVLQESLLVLAPQGRLSVISFHSLEDRIVKQFMRQYSKPASLPAGLPLTQVQIHQQLKSQGQHIQLKLIAKLKPDETEIAENSRARSAVLRIAEQVSQDE